MPSSIPWSWPLPQMRDERPRNSHDERDHSPSSVFQGFDFKQFSKTTRDCVELLQDPEGLDRALDAVKAVIKPAETAYALACDVVAADGSASQEELRFLEIFRHHMDVDRLEAAAIERGARARFRVA